MKTIRAQVLLSTIMLVFSHASSAQSSPTPIRPSLALQLYDFASVDRRTLSRAEDIVTRIYQQAGVDLHWIEACNSSSNEPVQCDADAQHGRGIVITLTGDVRKTTSMGGHRWSTLAMAGARRANTQSTGEIAVSYDRVQAVADSYLSGYVADFREGRAVVLACILAHELGHLLLPDSKHAPFGIMRELLGREEWVQALKGILGFDAAQAALLRQGAIARNQAINASDER